MKKGKLLLIGLLSIALPSIALEQTVTIHQLTDDKAKQGIGKAIGTLTLEETPQGLLIKSNLTELPPGEHGFHIHENPSCQGKEKEGKWVPGLAAGDHYDPAHTGKHLGPFGSGHRGDLPFLIVNEKGQSQQVLLAPHLKLAEVKGRSFIIHKHGDNYADHPQLLGGGGPRIACGIIE
jgi:superoxide dismutase, Cu-Zn family